MKALNLQGSLHAEENHKPETDESAAVKKARRRTSLSADDVPDAAMIKAIDGKSASVAFANPEKRARDRRNSVTAILSATARRLQNQKELKKRKVRP